MAASTATAEIFAAQTAHTAIAANPAQAHPAAPAALAATTAISNIANWIATDGARKWLCWGLAIFAASQLYFVRELFAAFALFVLAFAAIAGVVVVFYMLQKSWELALARIMTLRRPALQISPVPHETRKPA